MFRKVILLFGAALFGFSCRPALVADTKLDEPMLKYKQPPPDNPAKGFASFLNDDQTFSDGFPHSLHWKYFPLNALMPAKGKFDWSDFEAELNKSAKRRRQLCARVYISYPSKPLALPKYLIEAGVKIHHGVVDGMEAESPDYDDPRMVEALLDFIREFGKRYDGDPRIAYLHAGLVGWWGEWHTWPRPEIFASDKTVQTLLRAFDAAFDRTQVQVRYPDLGGGILRGMNLGFHDDSWPFRYSENGKRISMTLSTGHGGVEWSFLSKMVKARAEKQWMKECISGEVRPEIQKRLFEKAPDIDDLELALDMTHVTWLMNHQGMASYGRNNPKAAALVARMGYNLFVSSARSSAGDGGNVALALTMENRGVAPFYYSWPVVAALLDGRGKPVAQWNTDWDLSRVMPLTVRPFREWGQGDERQALGRPVEFKISETVRGLKAGRYRWAIRVVHPMEAVSMASGGSIPYPRPFRFSNQSQLESGWLILPGVTLP